MADPIFKRVHKSILKEAFGALPMVQWKHIFQHTNLVLFDIIAYSLTNLTDAGF